MAMATFCQPNESSSPVCRVWLVCAWVFLTIYKGLKSALRVWDLIEFCHTLQTGFFHCNSIKLMCHGGKYGRRWKMTTDCGAIMLLQLLVCTPVSWGSPRKYGGWIFNITIIVSPLPGTDRLIFFPSSCLEVASRETDSLEHSFNDSLICHCFWAID